MKKRQVMNQVFGNYRLKMAEERRVQEKAANNHPEPNIQEVTARDTQSVSYRKSSKDVRGGALPWFTPSSSDFSFNFFTDKNHQHVEGGPGDGLEDLAKEVKCTETPTSQQDGALCIGSGSAFTFSFRITEDTGRTSESSAASGDHLPNNHTAPVTQEILSRDCSNLDNPASTSGASANQTEKVEAVEKSTADSPKKKRKKKSKYVVAQTQNKVEKLRGNVDTTPTLQEEPQSGADELRRELDWCMEQLKIGLQRQKSTPKQVDEALRAIKTLRSEKVPLVKKRQVMRIMFGDYRQKMEEERIKQIRLMQAASKSAKMTEVMPTARQNSSKVFRKSYHKSTKSAAPNSTAPADTQGSTDHTTASSSQQEFTFRPSQEAFCFNFF
ncbi:UPF0488 protein C8orf33 homolog isoform X2 [Rhinoderma darwinii]